MERSNLDVESAPLMGSIENGNASSSSERWLCLCAQCHRAATELWRRIKLEVVVEWPMLKQRWMILVFGIVMQYVHGIFTQLAHRMHQPQEQPLHDLGFAHTPELGPKHFWVSEAIFGTLFGMFVVWTFTPFVLQHKRFYTVVMWSRLLMVLVVCQALRIVTFTVTQLPGPSYHCRAGEPTAVRPWPEHWSGHVVVDVQRQMAKSCGDLIFSSHTTFLLTGILAYTEYGSWRAMKAVSWLCGVIVCTLIIASRKHYTVDIVIAWYTVPLVFYTLHRRWTTRRPMSEFLGAIGENDEPDPSTPDNNPDGSSNGSAGPMLQSIQVRSDKANGTDVKTIPVLSQLKERSAHSLLRLGGWLGGDGAGQLDQDHKPAANGLLVMHVSSNHNSSNGNYGNGLANGHTAHNSR